MNNDFRYQFPKESLFNRIKWALFGETKILYWFIGIGWTVAILFWGTIAVVAIHFIQKFW